VFNSDFSIHCALIHSVLAYLAVQTLGPHWRFCSSFPYRLKSLQFYYWKPVHSYAGSIARSLMQWRMFSVYDVDTRTLLLIARIGNWKYSLCD